MKALKRSILALALAAGAAAPSLLAQPPSDHPPGPPPGEHGGKGGPGGGQRGDKLKKLSEELGLTEEQKTQLKPILAEEAAALKAIRDDQSIERDAKWEKAKAVQESFAPKIAAILTAEQKAKFEKIKADARGGRGPGGPKKDHEEKK